jgi:phosphatidylglycerophosphatase C
MHAERVEQICARIEAEQHTRPGGAVACDGDGTLWSGDVGEDFFHALVDRARFEPDAVEAMNREAAEHHVVVSGDGPAIAATLYGEYLEQRFPEERICEVMAWGCAGWNEPEITAFARHVVAQGALPTRLHAEAVRVLEWAKKAGIEVFLVSASPLAVVECAASEVGIDRAHVVAATPKYNGATMRAEVMRPIPYGPGKVARLRERIGERPLYAAFGDNVFDIPMLRDAIIPVAVRPKPRLTARAGEVKGLVSMVPLA